MKAIKLAIAVIGLLGIVGVFLPYADLGSESWNFLKTAKAADVAIQAYLAIAGFGLAALMGILAAAQGGLARWQAIVALIGFGIAIVPDGVRKGFDANAIGGKVLLLAAIAGLVVSIVGIAKPEKA